MVGEIPRAVRWTAALKVTRISCSLTQRGGWQVAMEVGEQEGEGREDHLRIPAAMASVTTEAAAEAAEAAAGLPMEAEVVVEAVADCVAAWRLRGWTTCECLSAPPSTTRQAASARPAHLLRMQAHEARRHPEARPRGAARRLTMPRP